jgi:lysyl-tRNA synthetase class I
MQTSVTKNICPNCGAVDSYDLLNYSLIDLDLNIDFKCEKCKHSWTNCYGLFYLGWKDDKGNYDRDGLKQRY